MSSTSERLPEVHRFRVGAKAFAFRVDSRECYEIDEVVWDALAAMSERPRNDCRRVLADRYGDERALSGLLEADEVLASAEPVQPEPEACGFSPEVMALLVSEGCNLRCRCCYLQQPDRRVHDCRMSTETARRAVQFFAATATSQDLLITFFGGEPLLNAAAIGAAVEAATIEAAKLKKRFAYRVCTNGTIYNEEVLSYLSKGQRGSLQISLDGPRWIHDKNRPFVSGEGSFEVVVQNVRRSLRYISETHGSTSVSLAACFSRQNLDIYGAFVFLAGLGVRRITIVPYDLPSVHPACLRPDDMTVVRRQYRKIGEEYLELLADGVDVHFAPFAALARDLLCPRPVVRPCSAGVGSFAVAPNGDIYPCQMLDGLREHRMGDLSGGVDLTRQSRWGEDSITGRPSCSGCWIRNLCRGGCRACAIWLNGSMATPVGMECLLRQVLMEEVVNFVSKVQERGLEESVLRCFNV